MAGGVPLGLVVTAWPGLTLVAPGARPTPNAKAPRAAWPSTARTVRQATVYTPSGSEPRGTCSSFGCPGTAAAGPDPTLLPLESRTLTDDKVGSGASPKVSVTTGGALARVLPSDGSDDWRSECAETSRGSEIAPPITSARMAAARPILDTTLRFARGGSPATQG